MTNNLDLAARILKVMSADDRGAILGAMNSEVAAKITKIMDPES
jgi:flagellar motility protein MotE (MotC chaperone)